MSDCIESITLERTGLSPIRFRGKLLATASGQFVGTPPDKPNADWFEVSIYRYEGSGFIVAVIYRRDFKGAREEERLAERTGDPAQWLEQFTEADDHLDMVIGFPPGMEHKQARLEEKLDRQFATLVSAVLKDFPEEIGDQP